MKVFELINGLPTVTIEAILTFQYIYDRDTSKDKHRFYQEMEYIYFMCHYKSYYLAYPEEERQGIIIKDYIKIKDWQPDNLVSKAIKKFKELQKTESLGLLQDAKYAIEQMRGYWRNVDFEEKDSRGALVYNPTVVSKSIADAAKMIETIEKLQDKVEKEMELNTSVKGKSTGTFFEDK